MMSPGKTLRLPKHQLLIQLAALAISLALGFLPYAQTGLADDSHLNGEKETYAEVGISTPESMLLSLAPNDLNHFVDGVRQTYFETPILGRHDERIEQTFWFGTVGIEGLSYSFRLKDLYVTPQAGELRLEARIADLGVQIDKIYFNANGTRYCSAMPINSQGERVPFTTRILPRVTERNLDIKLAGSALGLTSSNFVAGRPAECHALWGFNWLIKRALPWLSSLVRTHVADGIETAIAQATQEYATSVNDLLQVNITLPFAVEPAPAFYATVSLWPEAFELNKAFVQFKMGADISFDPDVTPRSTHRMRAVTPRIFSRKHLPSYFGIGRPLLAAILAEANRKGLFTLRLSPETMPQAAEILTHKTLAEILPDAATRFDPEAAIAVDVRGASATEVHFLPHGPGEVPIIELVLTDLSAEILVDGKPYYHLQSDLRLRFGLRFHAARGELKLELADIAAAITTGQFAANLTTPANASRDDGALQELLQTISTRIGGRGGQLLSVEVPALPIGDYALRLMGSSIRGDYVTLDAQIR